MAEDTLLHLLEESLLEGLAGPLATGLLKLAGGDADVLHVAPEHEVDLEVVK